MLADKIVRFLIEQEDEDDFDDFDIKDLLDDRYIVKYLVFKAGSGPYGSGGWSRHARHRPLPQLVSLRTTDVVFTGKSVFVNGVRRLKANVWQPDGKPVRIDYPEIKFETESI